MTARYSLHLEIIVDIVKLSVLDEQRPPAELAAAARQHTLRAARRDLDMSGDGVVAAEKLRRGQRVQDRGAGIERVALSSQSPPPAGRDPRCVRTAVVQRQHIIILGLGLPEG